MSSSISPQKRSKRHIDNRDTPSVGTHNNQYLQVGHDYNKPKTVTDLLRDISGATFNENEGTPDIRTLATRQPRANSSMAKDGSPSKKGQNNSLLTTHSQMGSVKRAASAMRGPLKSVNEVFSGK